MSNKDDLGPMGNYLRSVNDARAYGRSSDPWANERVRVEKQLEKERTQSAWSTKKATPIARSSARNWCGKVCSTEATI